METVYPPDNEMAKLFHWYGWAVFESAGLEESLVLLIAINSCRGPADRGTPAIRALMDHRRKQTLGKLIQESIQTLGLPKVLTDEYEAALTKRNWLVHNFYGYFVPEFVNDEGRKEVFLQLRRLRNMFMALHDRAIVEIHKRLRERGFSVEAIHQETERFLRLVKEGALNPDD